MSGKEFHVRFMGILALLLALIAAILYLEPEKPGISRAQAAKAAALFSVSRERCIQYQEESGESHFQEKERGNWYVIYMDYLYDHGGLSEEYTESTAKAAQQKLTYQEAKLLAGFLGKKYGNLVNVNRSNQDQPFPAEQWWQIYEEAVLEKDERLTEEEVEAGEDRIQALDVILYGTPTNVEAASSWTCYTSEGDFRFEGLALDAYLDRKVRIYVRNGEIAGAGRLLSEHVVYENVWVESFEGDMLSVHAGTITRQFSLPDSGMDAEEIVHNIVDLNLKKGKLEKVTMKKDRIRGKVLAVGPDFIEIEGYGPVPLAHGFRVYKVYGEYEEQTRSDILVGYDLQEFVAADGKLCAALTVRPFHAERIRVLLMDDGFRSVFHGQVTLTLNGDAVLTFGEKGEEQARLEAGTQLTIQPGDDCLAEGRAVITPLNQKDGIRIDSISRGQGNPVYDGTLEIRQEGGSLVLVNELFLEDYLKKVVPSEMPAGYEMEALKAQAVCARTYAYRQIIGNSYSQYGAHVDDSTNFQVYNNVEVNIRTSQAVDETCGKILTYEGNPVEAYYYSTSCGHGTDGSVWGGDGSATPYLKATELSRQRKSRDLTSNEAFAEFIQNPDVPAFDSGYPMYRWTALYRGSTLGRQLGLGQVVSLEVTRRGPGGVVQELTAVDQDGQKKTYHGQMEVRKALGSTELEIERKDGKTISGMSLLPSAFIAVWEVGTAKDGSNLFQICGGGYGHGVGMSQNGAQGMAKEGMTCEEILQFFYEGTKLEECGSEPDSR